MGPPSLLSGAPSTVGSGGSSEWGREYEDEDTWYEFSTPYAAGSDTHLVPSKDTGLSLRMAEYRRTLGMDAKPAASAIGEKSHRRLKRDRYTSLLCQE